MRATTDAERDQLIVSLFRLYEEHDGRRLSHEMIARACSLRLSRRVSKFLVRVVLREHGISTEHPGRHALPVRAGARLQAEIEAVRAGKKNPKQAAGDLGCSIYAFRKHLKEAGR